MSLLTDPADRILAAALEGLSDRQAMTAANIANVDTPGYAPRTLDFESALRAELAGPGGDPADRRPPTSGPDAGVGLQRTDPRHLEGLPPASPGAALLATDGSLRNDGNRVDVEAEMSDLATDQLRFTAVSRLLTARLGMLREAARSGR